MSVDIKLFPWSCATKKGPGEDSHLNSNENLSHSWRSLSVFCMAGSVLSGVGAIMFIS